MSDFPPWRRVEDLSFREFEEAANRGVIGPAERHVDAEYRAVAGRSFTRITRLQTKRNVVGERLRGADVGMSLGYRLEDICRYMVHLEVCDRASVDMIRSDTGEKVRVLAPENMTEVTPELLRAAYDAVQSDYKKASKLRPVNGEEAAEMLSWRNSDSGVVFLSWNLAP